MPLKRQFEANPSTPQCRISLNVQDRQMPDSSRDDILADVKIICDHLNQGLPGKALHHMKRFEGPNGEARRAVVFRTIISEQPDVFLIAIHLCNTSSEEERESKIEELGLVLALLLGSCNWCVKLSYDYGPFHACTGRVVAEKRLSFFSLSDTSTSHHQQDANVGGYVCSTISSRKTTENCMSHGETLLQDAFR